MRDPDRIGRIIAKMSLLWCKWPDTRLVQLVLNQLPTEVGAPYYVEDDVFERQLDEAIARMEKGKNDPV